MLSNSTNNNKEKKKLVLQQSPSPSNYPNMKTDTETIMGQNLLFTPEKATEIDSHMQGVDGLTD